MKIIDLYQMAALPYNTNIPVINAGIGHFSYTGMSIFPYDRDGNTMQEDKKNIIQQRYRYENYRKEHKISLLETTQTRLDKNNEKYIYHITSLDTITTLSDLKKIYAGGIRIFQPRRESNNARGEYYANSEGGLNQRGMKAIQRLSKREAIIDCTHAHEQTIAEITTIHKKPMILRASSKSLYPSIYNYEDSLLENIIKQGGLICIPLDQNSIGDNTLDTWVRHIRYIISKRGDMHIAFASGRNATLQTEYIERASHTQDITHIGEQLTKTFGRKTTEKILRNNAYNFFKKHFMQQKNID